MANDSASLDGLFPVSPSIDSLVLGTGDNDVLSAQADGNIVLGFDGEFEQHIQPDGIDRR